MAERAVEIDDTESFSVQEMETEKEQEVKISFDVGQLQTYTYLNCSHKLADANYNDIEDLALNLDGDQYGGACKGIMKVMAVMLPKNEHFIQVWRSCRGGESPAMGFISLLITKGIMLAKFKKFVDQANIPKASDYLQKYIESHPDHTLLENVDYQCLTEIAGNMSENLPQQSKSLQGTWENVAGAAGLKKTEIEALRTPYYQAREDRSLTKELFSFLAGMRPNLQVTKLIEVLHKLERHELVERCPIFEGCRNERCFEGDAVDLC